MSHTTELDNGVIIIYDGGDLGGPVYLRHPDMPSLETTWAEIWHLIEIRCSKGREFGPAVKICDINSRHEFIIPFNGGY